jgi:hypothetical protein
MKARFRHGATNAVAVFVGVALKRHGEIEQSGGDFALAPGDDTGMALLCGYAYRPSCG